jgi:hypothetical protein
MTLSDLGWCRFANPRGADRYELRWQVGIIAAFFSHKHMQHCFIYLRPRRI